MARVKMSAVTPNIAGKMNGSTFVNTRYGLCLQNKAKQRKFPRAKQLQKRQSFKFLSSIWQSLTDEQRAENDLNALNYPLTDFFGDTYYLSGYALLLRSNLNLNSIGFSTVEVVPATPPNYGEFSNIYGATIYAIFNNFLLRVFFDFSGSDLSEYRYILSISPVLSVGIDSYRGNYVEVSNGNLTSPYVQVPVQIGTGIQAGLIGSVLFMRFQIVAIASGVVVNDVYLRSVIS